MELLAEKTEDEGFEKHVPVVEKTETGIRIKVGSIPHPMEEKHYIEWIELIIGRNIYRKFLKPGDNPEAEFNVDTEGKKIEAREYCNIHSLWKHNIG
jgi:superoxide reductase